MAFLRKQRDLPSIYLCGNPLPWVNSLKHLGTMVTNQLDGCQLDMKQKMAQYIDRNCNLNQEFSFTHPMTKIKVNNIYNCHFSSFQVWNLFSPGAASMEGTFNRSVKIMADLPYPTHRYLIEPLAGTHWKTKMIRGYLGFIGRVRKSAKPVLKQMYHLASRDVRTVTGTNLRNILMLTDKLQVDDLEPSLVDSMTYHKIEEHNTWRVGMIKELIDMKHGQLLLPEGWTNQDLETLMNYACSQ